MIEIKDLLARFHNILLSEEGKRESVARTISLVIGVKIKLEDVKIKNNIINLNIKPIYKNEIYLKKEEIFSRLQELFGKKTPENFR